MNMVWHQVAFQHPAFLLLRQAAEDFAQMLPQPFIQHPPSAFGDE
jgi:hypothetical protein